MTPTEIVNAWYETRDRSLTHDEVEFLVCETFPEGGTYRGHAEVYDGFFPKLYARFDSFGLERTHIIGNDDTVIVVGNYTGRVSADAPMFRVPFTHLWSVENGVIIKIVQHAETGLLNRAFAAARKAA